MVRRIPNLYVNKSKGKTYYRYKHPLKGTWHGMGTDKRKASQAARELNARFISDDPLVSRVVEEATTVKQHISWFMRVHLPTLTDRPKTIEMYQTQFTKLIRLCGTKPINSVSVKALSAFMEECSPNTARQFKQCSSKLWQTAIAKGIADDNPAAKTMVPKAVRERSRLSYEVFQWVKQAAEPWLANAMMLALITLQRRSDLCQLKHADLREGHLYITQQKTAKYASSRICIEVTDQLQQVVNTSREIVNVSPYLVCRIPTRKNSSKDHWSRVSPDLLTREFKKVLMRCPLLTEEERDNPPTVHEIRALGIKMYRDQGKDPQELAGHSNESMTDAYDSGHTNSRWNNVKADLDL